MAALSRLLSEEGIRKDVENGYAVCNWCEMELSEQTIGAVIALSGVLAGGLFTFLGTVVVTWMRERNETKRHLINSALKMAEVSFTHQYEAIIKHKLDMKLTPITRFMMAYLVVVSRASKIKSSNVQKELNEIREICDVILNNSSEGGAQTD